MKQINKAKPITVRSGEMFTATINVNLDTGISTLLSLKKIKRNKNKKGGGRKEYGRTK